MQKGIEKYVNDLKEARARELDNLAINIQRAMLGEIQLDELDTLLSDHKNGF